MCLRASARMSVRLCALSADGFADQKVKGSVMNMHAEGLFRDCLFKVLPQQQYGAQRELAKFVAAGGDAGASGGGDKDDRAAVTARLTALRERAAKEVEANNNVVAHFAGAMVTYGMVVQLQHVKSKRVRRCCCCLCLSVIFSSVRQSVYSLAWLAGCLVRWVVSPSACAALRVRLACVRRA